MTMAIRALMPLWFLLIIAWLEIGDGQWTPGQRYQCVQFGLGTSSFSWDKGNNEKNSRERTGVWTIGTKAMDAEWLGCLVSYINNLDLPSEHKYIIRSPQDAPCPWTKGPYCGGGQASAIGTKCVIDLLEPCVDNSLVRMNLDLVKQGDRILHGWLHIQIELLDQSQKGIELIYIQMQDEQFQAIGEFVNADVVPGAACKMPPNLSTPKPNEFFPCGTTGPREAKVSQGLMMANKDFYFDKDPEMLKRLHLFPIKNGVHFLWRMNEYWCNRHQRIRPVALIMTKKNRELYQASNSLVHGQQIWRKVPNYWIQPNWFGAADVIFKRGQDGELDCSVPAINDNTGELSSEATSSWLRASTLNLLKMDYINPLLYDHTKDSQNNEKIEVCQVNPTIMAPQPSFQGRCSNVNEKWSSRKYFHECETDTNAPQFEGLNVTKFQSQEEFIQEKKKHRSEFCVSVSCRLPSTQEEYDAIMSFQPQNDTEDDVKPDIIVGKNDPRTRSKKFKLRAARRYHGITFGFLAFFITPVSVFVARYFKETFMRRRCYGVHVWYWTHIGGIVSSLCLGFSGHSALSQFYRVWGRATEDAASLHRILGYGSYGAFFFLVVFGGFRIRAPGIGRICSITLHAVMGFTHHWLNLAAVIFSTWIPMSPSLHDCDENGLPKGLSTVFWLAVAWIAIDFIFHLILTVLHIHRDRVIGIRRSWYFPIVPLADNDQMADMAGEGMRKAFLWIYIGVSLIMAVTCATYVMENKLPTHCQFGNSTCKSWAGCTQLGLKYTEWHKHQGGT